MQTIATVTALIAGVLATPMDVATIGAGNALTLPSQRHLVRIAPPGAAPVYLLALQREWADGRGLAFWRSDDEGETWREHAPIQDDPSHRDRADLIVVGNDIAMVISYEGPELEGSTLHDVYFQWWRYHPGFHDWVPEPKVRVFDSTSSMTAYSRALLARDSLGRLWVQAFRLEPDGGSTSVIAVSSDGGETFAEQPALDRLTDRGGGRLLALGDQLVLFYGSHGDDMVGRVQRRADTDPLAVWTPPEDVLPEGIYHGAALSAVADGRGGAHVVYKSGPELLYYRYFDGEAFGPPTPITDRGDWALQPAVTLVGEDLYIFYNRPITLNLSYELRVRVLTGGQLGESVLLDGSATFKGYLASAERLPSTIDRVPCFYSATPDENSSGTARLVLFDREPTPPADGGPDDGGPPGEDGGPPGEDGGPDAGGPAADGPGPGLAGDLPTWQGRRPSWSIPSPMRPEPRRPVLTTSGCQYAGTARPFPALGALALLLLASALRWSRRGGQ